MQRTWADANSRTDDVTVQLELKGQVQTAAIEHELLLGAENYRYRLNQRLDASAPTSPYAINIYNPVYGQARPALLPARDLRERQRGRAVYAQDVMRLSDDWRLMLGVRHDRHSENQFNRLTNTDSGQRRTTATSPRVGLSWLATPNWTLFASASRSFSPTSGADAQGRPFEPERGRAKEGGVKWENAAQTAGMTLSLFDIRKQNILTADPNNPRFSVTAGEVRSRGVEIDFSGQLNPHWRVIASASRLNATVSRDNNLAEGKPLLGAAKFSASALLMFEDTLANGARYRLGAGVVHVGRRVGQSITRNDINNGVPTFYLPAYTTARLIAAWHVNDALRLSLDVDNLFDKTHYASAANSRWVMPGAGRTFNLALQARF